MRLAIIRTCPICKYEFKVNLWNHFWTDHKDLNLTDSEFILKLNNLTEIPKCKICNNLAKLNYCNYNFYNTCGNKSCGAKIRFNKNQVNKTNSSYTCICGKSFDNSNSYASHTKYCIDYCNLKGRLPCKSNLLNYNKVAWNKGLRFDFRCIKHKNLYEYLKSNNLDYYSYGKRNITVMSKLDKSEWSTFIELNDNLKLGSNIINKLGVNSWGHGIKCELSVKDIMELMKRANIKSSDWSRGGYDLARYNDTGPYSVNNCRFITHKENMNEINRL